MTPLRLLALLLGLAPLSGCAALASLDSAAEPLATYELTTPAPSTGAAGSGRALLVEAPTASGGLATDRIMIKPGALQVAYLPDGRWVDAAPVHVQQLLVRALSGTGRLGFVGGQANGPLPDYVLLTDLEAFQAELVPGAAPARVVVRMRLTLMRDLDRRILGARRFERTVAAPADDAATVVAAFDAAMRGVLAEATAWTLGAMAGAGA